MHICMCIYIFISKYILLNLHMWVYLLLIWHWKLSWRRPIPILLSYLVAYSSLCRVEALWAFPKQSGIFTGVILVQSMCSGHLVRLYRYNFLCYLPDKISQQASWSSSFLQSFHHVFLQCYLSLSKGLVCKYNHWGLPLQLCILIG